MKARMKNWLLIMALTIGSAWLAVTIYLIVQARKLKQKIEFYKYVSPLAWQKLNRRKMKKDLAYAQSDANGYVVCAGCGRAHESEYLELDHIHPKADGGVDWIFNRILFCGVCNRRKGANLTYTGLIQTNRKDGWMKDKAMASIAYDMAKKTAENVENDWNSPGVQALVK